MRRYFFISTIITLFLLSCKNKFYSKEDYQSVLKIDSHVHINSEKGFFEDQALKENFRLITLNVDHSDSSSVRQQLDLALISSKKFPGKVFYGATFCFDTAGWGTDVWSKNVIGQLNRNISGGAISVTLWKNIGMTVRVKNGKFIMVDDPELKPVIDFIISKNLPITGHMGEPRNCWLPLREMTVRSDSDLYVTCSISLPGTANGFAISALNIRTGSCMVRTFRIMGLIMVRR